MRGIHRLAVEFQTMLVWLWALVAAQTAASQSAPCSFNSLCSCKAPPHNASRDVSCVAVPLARMPEMPGGAVTHMDIVSSGLEFVDNDAFSSTRVESLRLISNNIQFIGDRAFSETSGVLRSLDLSYNELDEIPFEAFQPLKHLDWLNLHSNQIPTLSGDWGNLCSSVSNIFLGENDLTELQRPIPEKNGNNGGTNGNNGNGGTSNGDEPEFDFSLSQCELVSWLNVDHNKLTAIPPGQLPRALQTLSASYNLIQKFPSQALDELPELAWLYLRGNYIQDLPDHTFRHKKRLDRLDLGENALQTMPSNPFNNSLAVRDLNLDNNFIKTLPPQAFRGMNTGRIYLSMNRLEGMDDRSFSGLSHTLEYLDIGHNHLQNVPAALSQLKRLRYLYMPSNKISELQEDAFLNFSHSLKSLSLQGNQLNKIPKDALFNCTKLAHLNVGYNQIYEIESDDFFKWGASLDTLLLRSNRIGHLDAHIFRETPRLRELSLSFNKLNEVHPEAFMDLSQTLRSLEVSFSLYREDFPEDFLKPLTSLQWLAIDNNNIRTISPKALTSFSELQYLNLEANRLSRLQPNVFRHAVHKNLRDVRLSYNLLETIETGTFSYLLSLQTVVLSGNKIHTVKTKAFRSLPNLVTLMISFNRLSVLEPNCFVDLPNILKLDLQNNELKEFSLGAFSNVSGSIYPMSLNLSRNHISSLDGRETDSIVRIKVLDLSHNRLHDIPFTFLRSISDSLRRLYIAYNKLSKLDISAFGSLPFLEILKLQHNNIVSIKKGAFWGLESLQILDLSHNHIEQLQSEQFSSVENLRQLDLSHNLLRSLSRGIFYKTKLEKLDLSHNVFVVMPSSALEEVSTSLRYLDMSHNHLEHLDSTMFSSTPQLLGLNLARNRLTILPDNVFTSLGDLLTLDLGGNPLRANFKELFHYVHRLRSLGLADTGLRVVPHLPLPRLVALNLSNNSIKEVPELSVEGLQRLRTLSLSRNQLTNIPAHAWPYLPLLKKLDVSENPIKLITKESLSGLGRLETLDIRELNRLERFDGDALARLPLLTALYVQTWPRLDRTRFHLGAALAAVPSLRRLSVKVSEPALTDQLHGAFNPKLKHVEITGGQLKRVSGSALQGVEQNKELVLQLRGTQLEHLPATLFAKLASVPHLSLDLRDNRLQALSPHTLYPNGSSWENIGTKLIAGGLILKGNPWVCDCGLVWLGHWLRRWLRETFQIHTVVLEGAQEMQSIAREATCSDPRTGQLTPLLDLYPEDLNCHASALSRGGSPGTLSLSRTLIALALVTCYWW